MHDPVRITISADNQRRSLEWTPARPLLFGRQENSGEPMCEIVRHGDFDRIAILPFGQIGVSRRQLRIEPTAEGTFLAENLYRENIVGLGDERLTATENEPRQLILPVHLSVANCRIDLEPIVQTLSRATRLLTDIPRFPCPPIKFGDFSEAETADFVSFINSITSALQLATDEIDLCQRACDAIKQLIDADGAGVYRSDGWRQISGDPDLQPHFAALERVNADRRVTWRSAGYTESTNTAPTIEFYVAAPIVTRNDEQEPIYAAIYAHRRYGSGKTRRPLGEVQARLVELVACTVASGIARSQQEQQTSRFGGFFPPALAKKLIAGDDILQATKREVTLMFCDIRRFSSICETLGPELTSKWVGDLLSTLSACVQDFEGVLVDYIGDELLAMWGAPEVQPNQADLACRAALAMIGALPSINERWRSQIGCDVDVGIGINTGEANVGNTGSRQRFKYGPLGDAVNRASRVEGLTKHLQIPILITGDTRSYLSGDYPLRRIGNAKVINIHEPIELFELIAPPHEVSAACGVFEQAIRCLERGELRNAAELLRPLLDFREPDHPTLLLFNEIIDRLISEKPPEIYEWDFGTK